MTDKLAATWIFLGNMAISLFLGILICYKLGYYKNTISIFKIKNILFLLITTIILFIIYFFSYTYYNSHFITPGIAKDTGSLFNTNCISFCSIY